MQRLYKAYRDFEKKFFDGPAIYNYPGKRIEGYRSINLMIAQWIRAFSALYFTLAGRVLLIATGYILLNSMLTLLMPTYFLSITLFSLFIIDIVVGWILRPRLKVIRSIPELASANSNIQIGYTVTNISGFTCWDIYVDTIPFPGSIKFVRPRAFISMLLPGENVTLTNTINVSKRGCYRLPLPVADSSFPFGLWRWGSRGPANRQLLVYSSFTPLRYIHLPVRQRSQSSGNMSFSSTTGQSIDFHGCRAFRYGDNPRYIHAPSWARLREPVVKEFTDENTRHIAIFIDTFSRKTRFWKRFTKNCNDLFEGCLCLATATVDYLVKQNFKIDLFINGPDGVSIRQSEEFEHLEHILEILASIQNSPGEGFKKVSEGIIREISELSIAIVFLLDWDGSRRNFVRELAENGVVAKTLCITENLNLPGPKDDTIQNLTLTDIVGGNVQEL